MGLTYSGAKLLLEAKAAGVDFGETLTLGRQFIHIDPPQLEALGRSHGVGVPGEIQFGGFADSFFTDMLGCRSVTTADASDYEGCDLVHDMNQPVDAALHDRFDAVIDGGSLEHIFNFPIAIANCMRMTKVGGSLFVLTMANNHCGHGFYQFSPELFYRVLSPENGFEVQRMEMVAHPFPQNSLSRTERVVAVKDPADVRSRILLVSRTPVMLFAWAKRTADLPLFENAPYQSDYAAAWAGDSAGEVSTGGGLKAKLKQFVPTWIWRGLRGRKQLKAASFSNRQHYS